MDFLVNTNKNNKICEWLTRDFFWVMFDNRKVVAPDWSIPMIFPTALMAYKIFTSDEWWIHDGWD